MPFCSLLLPPLRTAIHSPIQNKKKTRYPFLTSSNSFHHRDTFFSTSNNQNPKSQTPCQDQAELNPNSLFLKYQKSILRRRFSAMHGLYSVGRRQSIEMSSFFYSPNLFLFLGYAEEYVCWLY